MGMKRVKGTTVWNWDDALGEAESSFAEVVRAEVVCESCGEIVEIKFPEMHVTHATEKHLKDYFDGALEEAYEKIDDQERKIRKLKIIIDDLLNLELRGGGE